MNDTYDVVVIGAGVNGLTAGAYLAKAGLDVAVVESRNECGAFALTEDLFGGGAPTDTHAAVCFLPMSPVWGDLALDDFGFELIPGKAAAAATWPDGKNLVFYYDGKQMQGAVERLSPADARRAHEIRQKTLPHALDLLWLFFQPASPEGAEMLYGMGEFAGFSPSELHQMNGMDLLDNLFTEEHIKLAWLGAGDIGLFGDVSVKGEGAVAVLLSSLFAVGTPRGGMHTLTHALVRCFRSFGGTLLLNAPVAHVGIGNVGAEGHSVVLSDAAPYPVGELHARHGVILNVSPPVAMQLLGEDQVKKYDMPLHEQIAQWSSTGHCAYISHFLVKGLPTWGSREWNPDIDVCPFILRAWDSWDHARSSQEHYNEEDTLAVLGDVAEIYNQTAQDATRMSRDGTCTVSVEIEYPVTLEHQGGFSAWDDRELTDMIHDSHADTMERLAPGFRNQIVDSMYFTPMDNWRRNPSALYGHEIGGDNSGNQWYLGRIPPRSRIPGVYFSQGIWPASLTHLGNGYVAACVVADDLGVRKQEWWNNAPMEHFIKHYADTIAGGSR